MYDGFKYRREIFAPENSKNFKITKIFRSLGYTKMAKFGTVEVTQGIPM